MKKEEYGQGGAAVIKATVEDVQEKDLSSFKKELIDYLEAKEFIIREIKSSEEKIRKLK